MKVAVIDDETPSRQVIINILNVYCPFAEIVAEEGSVAKAITAINETKPEVVFLDIELKGGNGFDVIRDLQYAPQIIFTTAYSQYAINAIKVHAFDYLLKPINEDELVNTIKKYKNHVAAVQKQKDKPETEINFFTYSSHEGKHVIRYTDIIYFESSGAYTYCVTSAGKTLISRNLGEVEREVAGDEFFRTHHSFIINLKKIIKVELKRNGKIYLENGDTVPVAQRKIKKFKSYLNDDVEHEE